MSQVQDSDVQVDPFWEQHLRERDQHIGELTDDVVDIHHALVDLSELMEDQRPMLGQIESNAEHTHDRVVDANRNLESTAEAARRPVSRVIMGLFLVVIILACIVVVKFSIEHV